MPDLHILNTPRDLQATKHQQVGMGSGRSIALHLEQAGTSTGKVTPPAPASAPTIPTPQSRITSAAAVKVFLSNREGVKIAPSTLRKYRALTNQLTTLADDLGYVMLDQLTSGDIHVFNSLMKPGVRAKAKRFGTLRAFSGST
jgi:hypothetical protein